MRKISKLVPNFLTEAKGSIAAMSAITLPVLIGFGALAVDVGYFYKTKSELQQAADIASLSAMQIVKEENFAPFDLYSETPENASIIDSMNANAPITGKGISVGLDDIQFGKWDFNKAEFESGPQVSPVNAVKITATMSSQRGNAIPTFLGRIFKESFDTQIESMAIFPIPPSFHMLSENAKGSLQLLGTSDIDISSLHVNSDVSGSIHNEVSSSQIGTSYAKTAGTMSGGKSSRIAEDEFPIADFLQDLPMPSPSGGCIRDNFPRSIKHLKLRPGIYCQGLTISNRESVEFTPGLYTFALKPLVIDESMRGKPVYGNNVVLYFFGKKANITANGGNLFFSGPKTGEYAGIPLISGRAPNAPTKHVFNSDSRLDTHGIFYAPDTAVEVYQAPLDGICRLVCFVSDTLLLENVKSNFSYYGNVRSYNPLAKAYKKTPPSPPALEAKMQPYIIDYK